MTEANELLEPEYVKDYIRNRVESESCPWYSQEQNDHDTWLAEAAPEAPREQLGIEGEGPVLGGVVR